MKKKNQNNNSIKEEKLPPIQSNLQKGNIKQDSNSKDKLNQKSKKKSIPQIPNIPLTNRNIPKDINQITNKSKLHKNGKKYNNDIKEEEIVKEQKKEEGPRITDEKLEQLKDNKNTKNKARR